MEVERRNWRMPLARSSLASRRAADSASIQARTVVEERMVEDMLDDEDMLVVGCVRGYCVRRCSQEPANSD